MGRASPEADFLLSMGSSSEEVHVETYDSEVVIETPRPIEGSPRILRLFDLGDRSRTPQRVHAAMLHWDSEGVERRAVRIAWFSFQANAMHLLSETYKNADVLINPQPFSDGHSLTLSYVKLKDLAVELHRPQQVLRIAPGVSAPGAYLALSPLSIAETNEDIERRLMTLSHWISSSSPESIPDAIITSVPDGAKVQLPSSHKEVRGLIHADVNDVVRRESLAIFEICSDRYEGPVLLVFGAMPPWHPDRNSPISPVSTSSWRVGASSWRVGWHWISLPEIPNTGFFVLATVTVEGAAGLLVKARRMLSSLSYGLSSVISDSSAPSEAAVTNTGLVRLSNVKELNLYYYLQDLRSEDLTRKYTNVVQLL